MVNSNIGKGLSELLGSNYNDDPMINDNDSIKEISLKNIIAGKYQPRMNFSQEELAELADSIKEKGVLQPILLKENFSKNGEYEIIAGERRYRASKLAGLQTIKSIILEVDEKSAYELALIENIQRSNLNSLEEALAIDKLVNQYEYSHQDMAGKLGKNRTYVTNLLRLLNLPEEVQNMLGSNELSVGHAKMLVNKEDSIILAKKIVKEDLSVRAVEKLMQRKEKKAKGKLIETHNSQKQNYLDDLAYQASNLIGMDISIKHNGKQGKFIIDFDDKNDIEYLLQIFKDYAKNEL